MKNLSDIGVIGLAVMGENLILNIERNGFVVSVYNRTKEKIDDFIKTKAINKNIKSQNTINEFVESLEKPRKILLMVKAGDAVDDLINLLSPLLEEGDILIDGGNSFFEDTNRRIKKLKEININFIGIGISGGEEGALNGPSIMPGGDKDSWNKIEKIFKAISAKVDTQDCCDFIGNGGSGHFVKMIHNGIEYGDMQIISESYQIMKDILKMNNEEISNVFKDWNKGDLNSYLIEITSNILKFKEGDEYLVDKILDKAGQKGTGQWTSTVALNYGSPLTLIAESVFARYLSSMKEERIIASKIINKIDLELNINKDEFIKKIKDALYASKIISYAQGYSLMKKVSDENDWNIDFGKIALIWKGGCIIRSVFLNKIKEAFDRNSNLKNILLDEFFINEINKAQQGWREVVSISQLSGVPVPAMSSALSYFDGYRSEFLPANLIQAQRDYFGSHTYERVDVEEGKYFHTNWSK